LYIAMRLTPRSRASSGMVMYFSLAIALTDADNVNLADVS